jgi:RNA polymerase sigma factor (sigma-70 family)
MTTIKYFDGNRTIEVEVNEQTATAYQEIRRGEWRQSKRIERNEAAISLTQMEDDNGYQLADTAPDPLDVLCEREEREERGAKVKAVLADLTDEQRNFIVLLRRGLSVTEIAAKLGISKSAVTQRTAIIQKKFQSFLP